MKPRRLKFVRITETNQNFREEIALGSIFPFSFWKFLEHKNAEGEERRGKTWRKIGEGENKGKRGRKKGRVKEKQMGEEINYSIKEIDNCKFKGSKTFD